MKKTDRKLLGKHDYDGVCIPGKPMGHFRTFSVGIFQWIEGKNGLKKSKVKYRVKGSRHDPDAVFKRAEELCDLYDSGWTEYKKSEFI